MNYGIASRSYANMTVAEAARFMALHGYNCTELCMAHPDFAGWVPNGVSRLDENGITGKTVKEKAGIFRDNGIAVISFGVFTNVLSPDDAGRTECLESFVRLMDCAAYADIINLSTGLGFRPGKRGLYAEDYESDFARLKEGFTFLGNKARERGLNICVEACVLDVIPSAKRLRDFIHQINVETGLNNLRVLLDPANFIANSNEDDMFRYLAPYTEYFHGKDRKVNDAYGRIIGDGEIDWVKFFENYFMITPDVPFIIEYSDQATTLLTNERVQRYVKQAVTLLALKGYNTQMF